jgi:1-phosphofructokinase family hexose kinase
MDKIFRIQEWTPGVPMRTNKWAICVGGKGLNSSVVLSQLGVETVGLGFFAGKTGEELVDLLKDYGIIPEPVWVGGHNRIAHVIAEEKTQIHSHVIVGQVEVNEAQKREFVEKFSQRVKQAEYVIFAGSLPPSLNDDFYIELIGIAKAAGKPTLIDSQKQYMLEAIKAKPNVVKLNHEEFEWTFDRKVKDLDDLIKQAREVRAEKELESFVITMAKDGMLAFTPQGDYLTQSPLQKAVNAAGAGDSVSSTLAWRFTLGESWESALKWSGAVSAATVLTERTGDVVMADVERIYKDVTVIKI